MQALLPHVPVSRRFCSPVSCGTIHSSQLNWGTLTASLGSRRATSCPTHLDGDNWPPASSPAAWNSLPVDLRDPGISLPSCRKKLKTYLLSLDWHLIIIIMKESSIEKLQLSITLWLAFNPYTAKGGLLQTPPCSFSPVSFSRIFFSQNVSI